ncbi:dTMP kinase [Immundisolibacter sp.]|uniref:dTMP kinase n=1 Tax=Immundisolibacter sp. TaxID=1934948 RepID=UPI00356B0D62
MRVVNRGRFITLEGMEGAGKTSRLADLQAFLQQRGKTVLATREPGGTALGEKLRALLLAPEHGPMTPLTELLLMFAARSEHIQQVILPALDAGQWVLCDRYVDASYAYQGAGRGLGNAPVAALEALLPSQAHPDLTLLLDLPVESGLARAKRRGAADRFEQETSGFHQRVREAYLSRARQRPQRYCLIDAALSPFEVSAAIERAVGRLL